ncbi:DUF6053 domain-containing protein [Lysobacter enzymogenes]
MLFSRPGPGRHRSGSKGVGPEGPPTTAQASARLQAPQLRACATARR